MKGRESGVGFCLLILFVVVFSSTAQVFDIVVDKNGTGDYTSIQEALDAVPDNQANRTLIFIKGGLYKEKVVSASTKKNVSIIGESAETVIISWNDYYPSTSASESYTFLANIAGLYMENVSIENTASKEFSGVGQALAIRTIGDSMAFKNCRYYGFQDTYYAHKNRNYNLNCYVEGGTDFIYGDATSVWDSCTIHCLKGGQYITAPADAKIITPTTPPFLHGLLFRHCDITAEEGVPNNQYFLGRPWNEKSSSVYIECILGEHIKSAGWATWEGNNHESAVFAEYKSTKPDGSLADVSSRVEWSAQLDSATVSKKYNLTYFLRRFKFPVSDTWDPLRVTTPLPAPEGVSRNGSQLTWQSVDYAKGFIILKDGVFLGFAETTTFNIPNKVDENAAYAIKSVSESGALSESSTDVSTPLMDVQKNDLGIIYYNGNLNFLEFSDYQIYSVLGKLLVSGKGNYVDISTFNESVFIVKASNKKGVVNIRKILK